MRGASLRRAAGESSASCASAPPSAPVCTERDHLYRDFFKVWKHKAQSLLHGLATHPRKRYLAEAVEAESCLYLITLFSFTDGETEAREMMKAAWAHGAMIIGCPVVGSSAREFR